MLPNTLIIGAPKCGTSSLHYYLSFHPETSMSKPKELQYFHQPNWLARREWYERQFEPAPVRGECTPQYTWYPHRHETPRRIHSMIPDAKLIYLVRDPIERLISTWVQRRSGGCRKPLDYWLTDYARPTNHFVAPSRYATQIEQYLEFFDMSKILVIDQHDLLTNRRETLREVFGFLGIDRDFHSPRFDEIRNSRTGKYALTRVGHPLWNRALAPALRRLPEFARDPVRRWTLRALSREIRASPTIDADTRARLEEYFQPEAERLRALTGKQFATWSV